MNKLDSWNKSKLSNFFFRLIRPSTWNDQCEVSMRVDEFVNKLIDDDLFIGYEELHTANFKTKSGVIVGIWVSNFPYSYGTIYRRDGELVEIDKLGPSMQTRYKLASYLASKKINPLYAKLNKFLEGV